MFENFIAVYSWENENRQAEIQDARFAQEKMNNSFDKYYNKHTSKTLQRYISALKLEVLLVSTE